MVYITKEANSVALYCLRSKTVRDRFYFGITVRPGARFREHINKAARGSTGKISCAIRKHGASTFEMIVLASFPTREQASKAEQAMITAYGGVRSPLLWNTTGGGDGGYVGAELSPESSKAFRSSWDKRKADPEWSAKRSAQCKRAWADSVDREKHSQAMRAALTPEVIAMRAAKGSAARRTVQARLRNVRFIAGAHKDNPSDVVVFLGTREAMRAGFDESSICKVLNGKAKIAGARAWKVIPNHDGFAARPDLYAELLREMDYA